MSDTALIATATPAEPALLPAGAIIVATDTTPEADAAFPLATCLAGTTGAPLVVLSVVPPVSVPVYGVDGLVVGMLPPQDAEAMHTAALEAQLQRTATARPRWTVQVEHGDPATQLTQKATAQQARLLVVGRGRHGALDRVFNGEMIPRLLQLGDTPVLATEATLTSCPRRVVIATDFSPFSRYAAQVAMTICAPDATIWLVHVSPIFDNSVPFLRDRGAQYRGDAAQAFTSLRTALGREHGRVEDVLLEGDAPNAVLAFAERQQADLVVSAAHGYGFLRRMVLGSVSAALIRRAPCSVLVVPGSAHTAATVRARSGATIRSRAFEAETIDAELAAFSARNAGRRCSVEVDDAERGVQLLAHDLPLAGTSFERRSATVTLMFGASIGTALHLSHSIPGATGVDVAANAGDVDTVLRISHAGGQTLVTLT